MHFTKPRLVNLVSYVLFAVSATVFAVVIAFTMNVDVLKNWVVSLPNGDIHAGDTITLQSTYTKVRAVTGVATRYLECQNSSHAYIRYPINSATADRAPGSRTGTGVILKVPTVVPSLPATCRFSINIRYQVYPWRTVTEFQSTSTFRLLPAVAPGAVSTTATQTSQSPVVSQHQFGSTSLLQGTSADRTSQSDSSQATTPTETSTSTPAPTPGLFTRVLTTVTRLL